MREIRTIVTDVDSHLEDALRVKHQLDADRWRSEVRPRMLRLFAARARTLTWSRALVKLVVEELYPDDLFNELVTGFDRLPSRRWPYAVAIAVALRRSWRRHGLADLARLLHVSLKSKNDTARLRRRSIAHRSRPSRPGLSGSPRTRQGSPLRSDPAQRGSRP